VNFVAKHLAGLFFVAGTFSGGASSQSVFHGTYFLALVTPAYIIVAIDSRETQGNVRNDRYCKIRPLSPNAFFFGTGATSAIDNSTNTSVFDARDIAQSVYAQFGTGVTNFADMARTWATQMESIYNEFPAEFAANAVDGTMAKGFFVGEDKSGAIRIAGQVISYQQTGLDSFLNEPVTIGPGPEGLVPLLSNGHLDLVREFLNGGQTQRAKKIIAELGPRAFGPDADAARYMAYVAAVRDWSGDSAIGGEIATIILERGKNWRWFHRPDFCPKN
jgi:hypothetical protein